MHQKKYTGCRVRVWRISGFCGYGDSVGIPTGFSVGMGWVWALKFNPHGSPGLQLWFLLTTDKNSYMGFSKNSFLNSYNLANLALYPHSTQKCSFLKNLNNSI